MTAAQRRRLTAVFAAAGISLGAAACSSAPSIGTTTGTGLSYDRVRSTALDLVKNKSTDCPFGLDFAKAAAAAGIGGTVAPAVTDGHSVTGNAGDGVPAAPWPSGVTHPPTMTEMPATPPSADITCSYRLGGSTVEVDLLATSRNDAAVSLALPMIQRNGRLSVDQLTRFAQNRPAVGRTTLASDGGTVAVARIALKGEGDLMLLLSEAPDSQVVNGELAGEPLRRAAEALAGQVH
ncbi:hypothetical protein [Kitasatospora sp. NPDC094011]|uniref:hypothetical protein n=1 Tax=Kitasatospora sp. NPDC094011 TaxID=3364090 RepID=UPI00382BE297